MKVAVVGAGAAAVGVIQGLSRWAPAAETTVVAPAHRLPPPPLELASGTFTDSARREIYGVLRRQRRFAFPPPKSHFGATLRKHPVDGGGGLWRSDNYGGLTAIWGGGMFPFTDRELEAWPISAADLLPYYAAIAERVGVTGRPDALDAYFTPSFVNRPPLATSPVIEMLCDVINSSSSAARAYDFYAGSSRLALETRSGHPRACDYLGECMLGCPRGSIWSAEGELDRFREEGAISAHLKARASRFVVKSGRPYVEISEGAEAPQLVGPFDRVFVAAGCIGSTELVMRSLGIDEGPRMLDNAVVSFPVFYGGHLPTHAHADHGYFSLCNASIGAVAKDPEVATAQVSLYPSFDHLWRFYTPAPMWAPLAPIWRMARWRLLLARVFFAGACNRTYGFRLRDDGVEIGALESPDIRAEATAFLRDFRAVASHAGFYVPPSPPSGSATSSHYAGTFPYGCEAVPERSGRLATGVYLADASTWNEAPSISPTFTIMANACRTAHEAIEST